MTAPAVTSSIVIDDTKKRVFSLDVSALKAGKLHSPKLKFAKCCSDELNLVVPGRAGG
jgi:hypothetical protein